MNKCVKVHALRKTGLKLIDYTVYLIVDIQISIYTIYISIVNVSLLAIALCTYMYCFPYNKVISKRLKVG